MLKQYDVIGPIVVDNLMNDSEKELFTPILYYILDRITKLIDEKDYESAVERYRIMALLLINHYNLKHLFNDIAYDNFGYNNDNFNPETSDHEKILKNEGIRN